MSPMRRRAIAVAALMTAAAVAVTCAHNQSSHLGCDGVCLSPSSLMAASREIGAKMSHPSNERLDPGLRRLLRDVVQAGEDVRRGAALSPEAQQLPADVRVSVIYRGGLADLQAAGFQPGDTNDLPRGGHLSYGRIAVSRLPDLAAVEHVVSIEGPRPYRPLLN
jgi:hypothetical protein